jgi:tetratricopeptide (TPR) repeat protein
MMPIHPHNYIQIYEAGIEALKSNPSDLTHQHQTVLALARAGALDFAITEYDRFALADVTDNEDIMALNGRLSKDLYLRASGEKAKAHALAAAQKYEAAFENTQGYYSGINSATMALMADLPAEHVSARIKAIEALLPMASDVTPAEHYFIEATRAECFLLKGERGKAAQALEDAINFDPLNYAAHATTLKQFTMICAKRGEDLGWLAAFKSPRPMHFAGHIRLNMTAAQQEALKISISDTLQQEDVGFGYGALAAGGDIIFAESLLEQGAELHLILPAQRDIFKRESVTAFGEEWGERFDACLARASSIREISPSSNWPDQHLNRVSGLSSMGRAILKSQSLNVDPLQLLILDDSTDQSYTATHARDWAVSQYPQYRISRNQTLPIQTQPIPTPQKLTVTKLLCASKYAGESNLIAHSNPLECVERALEVRDSKGPVQIALHLKLESENLDVCLDELIIGGAPQSIVASEVFATVLALMAGPKYRITYAGQVGVDTAWPTRCYTIDRAKS